jgi:cobalt-precorrin-5B (C1)-methyltransferase
MAGRKGKRLRSGFTTGTAAAAATKSALQYLLSGRIPAKVGVELLTGDRLDIDVQGCTRIDHQTVYCSVVKDAGDDPDITHGAEIGARVTWKETANEPTIAIRGGKGVGAVTKPGLEVPPGEAAINPGPQQMIRASVLELLAAHQRCGRVETEIIVPQGEALARRTLNARLGIVGGISILGTTGRVRPLSHEAYVATIRSAMSVARAAGVSRVVLSTGRRSERFAQERWPGFAPESFIQIGDYFARSMQMAVQHGFEAVLLALFFGKAVKMSQGIGHTHAGSARMSLERLAQWALEITADPDLAGRIAKANTARHAFDLVKADHAGVIHKVGREVVRQARLLGGATLRVGAVIFGFDGIARFESDRFASDRSVSAVDDP